MWIAEHLCKIAVSIYEYVRIEICEFDLHRTSAEVSIYEYVRIEIKTTAKKGKSNVFQFTSMYELKLCSICSLVFVIYASIYEYVRIEILTIRLSFSFLVVSIYEYVRIEIYVERQYDYAIEFQFTPIVRIEISLFQIADLSASSFDSHLFTN